jgi:hypothetical protein
MLTATTIKPAVPPKKVELASSLPRFGAAAPAQVGEALVGNIKHLQLADWVYNTAGRVPKDPRIGNLSIQDISSRVNVLLAVYVPALYFSLHPKKKHFWETNGRNVLLWFITLAIALATKSKRFGFNQFLDPFMAKKTNQAGAWQKVLNKFRPDYNYQDLLKNAGLSSRHASWVDVSGDNNALETLKMKVEQLAQKAKDKAKTGATLEPAEKELMENIPKFMNRLTGIRLASTGLNMLLTITIIGILAMEVVFRVIAPLDPDFDASKFRNRNKKQAGSGPQPSGFSVGNPSPKAATPFQAYRPPYAATRMMPPMWPPLSPQSTNGLPGGHY